MALLVVVRRRSDVEVVDVAGVVGGEGGVAGGAVGLVFADGIDEADGDEAGEGEGDEDDQKVDGHGTPAGFVFVAAEEGGDGWHFEGGVGVRDIVVVIVLGVLSCVRGCVD